ncbi:hypothetical protein MASR1M12_27820 [Erysipelotrichia bacterium]
MATETALENVGAAAVVKSGDAGTVFCPIGGSGLSDAGIGIEIENLHQSIFWQSLEHTVQRIGNVASTAGNAAFKAAGHRAAGVDADADNWPNA